MRKTVLALFLVMAASLPSAAMDGFDLGDMPPLPPPLLDDSGTAPSLIPPPGGLDSPLLQSGAPSLAPLSPPPSLSPPAPAVPSSAASTPATPVAPPVGYSPPTGSFGTPSADFADTPLPPPPPLAPPPVDDTYAPAAISGAPEQIPGLPGGADLTPPPLPGLSGQTGIADAGLADNETPLTGQITGGRVNVRAGPNTQYESVAVLTTGTPLTVLAKNGDWYKIVYPSEHLASIHKKFVEAEVPAEIPEGGVPGVVKDDNAEVHAFYWDKSTVVGTLRKGDPVVIRQERGQWYRIVPPANARAFVFAKYVKLDSDAPVVADTAPLPVNASVDMSAVSPDGSSAPAPKATPEEERVREIKETRARQLQSQLQAQLDRQREQEELIRAREEERVRAFEEQQRRTDELLKARAKAELDARMLQARHLESALQDLDSRLMAIDGEKARQAQVMGRRFGQMVNPQTVVGSATWAPPDPPAGGYVGWVENIGRVGGAPSPYRLTKGGEIRFWLVSDKHNLNEFTNLRVLLDGTVEHAGGTTASILKVDRIRLLTEWEIAGGMPASFAPARQQMPPGGPGGPGAPGFGPGPGGFGGPMMQGGPQQQQQQQAQRPPAQPYFDPYANAADVTDYSQPGFDRPPQGVPPQGFPPQPGFDPYAQQQGPPLSGDYNPLLGGGAGYTTGYTTGYPAGGGYYPPSTGDNVGTADLVTSVENVFGAGYVGGGYAGGSDYGTNYGTGGSYYDSSSSYYVPSTPEFPNARPATGEIRPSDSSQLPDVVGGIGSYSTSAGIVTGEGMGLRVGEVETDVYERPIINEILP